MIQPDSLAGRLLKFFQDNPAEELTYADITVKFGVSLTNANSTVNRLKQLGMLESLHVVRAKPKRDPQEPHQ